ncbi:tkl protein kinase [Plasmopara halstedii]|uniref:Tkl protein kinase n=1 Tax=Plasmopara halstedii TaxID=4781 RepID=A0A0P1AD70_PLAHL|nr:tkl protein kinase [Plasmopara halstedii]CEG38404.1 tkl protein kinase [Plasmopara halstedii]|eukprot:XP_024574773.1 tkl protein kinase [Plasmopara halstedii]
MKSLVAVKAYAPTSCSEHVVAAFSHEAAMHSVLNHPNIVRFHGMCIAPPTICLVFQLCQGNLANLLANQVFLRNIYPARQQLLISVGYMLDAARAVAYLHSFSPPFVHCDIQPKSFLVDAACNVKLSNFGESRCVTKLEQKTRASKGANSILEDKYFASIDSPMGVSATCIGLPWSKHLKKKTIEYTAPEMFENSFFEIHGEAADVYSLAVTMWDILNPDGEKFPRTNGDQIEVIKEILNGTRPGLSTTPTTLHSLIERSWHFDPGLRPSAKQIVATLEGLQEELCSQLALDLKSQLVDSQKSDTLSAAYETRAFPGSFLVDRLIDRRFVRCPAEAIRMGNALMDSCVLHHVNHSRSFENTSTARYYFSGDNVHSILPTIHREVSFEQISLRKSIESSLPMLARGSSQSSIQSSENFVRPRDDPMCRCRQLGQRLISIKKSRFSRQKHFEAAPEPALNILAASLPVEGDLPLQNDDNGFDLAPGTAATMA